MGFAPIFGRFIAAFVDLVLLWAIYIATTVMLDPLPRWLPGGVIFWCWFVLAVAYFAVLPATGWQGTLLQRVGRIKVTDINGHRIGLGRSMLRFVLSLFTFATGGIGYVVAAWMPKRQALHDFATRTVVVDRNAKPEAISGAVAPPLGWANRALGIAALLGAYGVIAIFVDAILDLNKRTEVMAALGAASEYRREVGAALLERKSIPPPPTQTRRNVRAVYARADGTVVVETADSFIKEGKILFKPSIDGAHVNWRCSAEKIAEKYLPATCRQ